MIQYLVVSATGAVVLLLAWLAGRGVILVDPVMLSPGQRSRKLLAALLWGAGVFLLLGQLLFPLTRTEEKAEAAGVEWLATLPEGFERAKASGRPVLVDAWATWCKACMDLKEKTLSDPTVIEVLRGFECVSPDMDAEANEAVWETYGIKGLPWVAVFRPDGTLVEESLLTDFEAAEPFRARLLRYGAVALGREVAPAAAEAPVTEGDTVASWLREKGYLLTLLLVFLGGLAASLTPCAYPAYFLIFGFLSMGGSRTRSQSLLLSLLTVAGIVVMYVSMGIAAALGGGAVGRIMGNPWVMGAIAGLFLLMALMSLRILPFGDFSRFKSFLATRQKANYLWAFIFGLVLGVIVAPCVGPVVLGILAYVAQGQDLLRGALLMTSFGLGMGVLFLGLGLSSHLMTRRPQVGALGEAMTTAFGVLFVTAALYYLKGVVPWERVFPWLAGIAG